MTQTDPLAVQFGGTHYKGLPIQPIEFGMARNYDAATFSVMKYVSRHRTKAGGLDLDKAAHFVLLRQEVCDQHPFLCNLWLPSLAASSIADYIAANGFTGQDAAILLMNDQWFAAKQSNMAATQALYGQIVLLRQSTYGDSK